MAHITERSGLAAPVERIVLVDEVERRHPAVFQSRSLPGHLLHIVMAGAVSQWAEGRAEVFGKGSVVWYHEDEPVRGQILRAPWRFITINFHAPAIPPPPDDRRVLPAAPGVVQHAKRLLAFWRNDSVPPLHQRLRCHRELLELLQRVLPLTSVSRVSPPPAKLWWRVERRLRASLDKPISLAELQRFGGSSLRTLIRACHAATGLPPMKRLRELRLGYAQGLVQHSDLPITEIAFSVGYARSQEFSRDYHRRFGITPRADRRRLPSYRELERPPQASGNES